MQPQFRPLSDARRAVMESYGWDSGRMSAAPRADACRHRGSTRPDCPRCESYPCCCEERDRWRLGDHGGPER